MKVNTIWFLSCMCICVIINVESTIHLNMDKEDFDKAIDFIKQVAHMNCDHNDLYDSIQPIIIKRRSITLKMWKFFLNGIIETTKTASIMVALVGSNIISSYIMSDSHVPTIIQQSAIQPSIIQQPTLNVIGNHQNLSVQAELCQTDFGCLNNACWRTCHSNVEKPLLWCFTNPRSNAREHYHCEETTDCFLCWECVEACHEW